MQKSSVIVVTDPTDELNFPGVTKNEADLRSWEWIYGHTPRFTLPLFTDEIKVEGGIIKKCDKNLKAIGQRLPLDVREVYLGSKMQQVMDIDTMLLASKLKCYLCNILNGLDPKAVALQGAVLSVVFAVLLIPICLCVF